MSDALDIDEWIEAAGDGKVQLRGEYEKSSMTGNM